MTSEASTPYLDGLPAPAPTELDAPFWEGARAHELRVQACDACGATAWPPEEICASCHSFERTWRTVSGRGHIFSWTRIWHPVHPGLVGRGPYLVVVVRLDDVPVLMIGNLLGDPGQSVAAGMPVEVVFEDHPAGHTLVQWRPRLP